jgi:hypothetical protein
MFTVTRDATVVRANRTEADLREDMGTVKLFFNTSPTSRGACFLT